MGFNPLKVLFIAQWVKTHWIIAPISFNKSGILPRFMHNPKPMELLTKIDIVHINYRTVKVHGGNFIEPHNFLHESNLDYIIEIIDAEMFGEPLYPNLSDKASIYFYNIICNHIFSDGNKRTGLEAASAFLKLNRHRLRKSMKHSDLYDFVVSVASGQKTLEECREWFKNNIEVF